MRGKLAALGMLVALGGCGGESLAAGDNPVRLEIEHSRFSRTRVRVQVGQTITFIVRNGDPIAHELIIGDDKVQDRHERGKHARHATIPGEVSVPAGEERTTSYTFARRGSVPFACHLPGHFAYGMKGLIIVE